MAKVAYRRSSGDKKWQDVKKEVTARDTSCRLLKIVTPQEMLLLRMRAGALITKLDPAHYLSVASRPELCYDPNNICLLNHYSHSLLDDFKNPITGVPINEVEVKYWWKRILKGNPDQFKYLENKGLV